MDSTGATECGIGIRAVAVTIDAVVWVVLQFVAVYGVAAATGAIETTATGVDATLDGSPAILALALWLGLALAYHTVLEWRYGRTLGKYLVSVRVRSADGTPVSLRSSLLRNLVRLVDWLPLGYVVGSAVIALSDRPRRLGDRLGDTVVVRE